MVNLELECTVIYLFNVIVKLGISSLYYFVIKEE